MATLLPDTGNVVDLLERMIEPHRKVIAAVTKKNSHHSAFSKPVGASASAENLQPAEKRLERFEQVRARNQAGTPIAAISRRLGMHRRDVRKFIKADSFPEHGGETSDSH